VKGRCYLCGSEAAIEGTDDHLVVCNAACHEYIITREARRELGFILGVKDGFVQGRKRALLIRLRKLRKDNPERRIRISRALSVKFE